MIKVIIFDLDGLLVDSQPLQYKAYNQVFTDYGYPLSEQDWYQWIHQSLSPKEWIEIHQLPLELEVIRSEKKEIYDQLIRDELVMKPGAKRAIEQLGSHYRLCVASASQLDSVGQVLDNFNIRWEFEQVVSDKDVEREVKESFVLESFKILVEKNEDSSIKTEATVKLRVGNEVAHTAAEGNGPVNALDNALRKALESHYPVLKEMHLLDYKVRVLNEGGATAAKVRVLIESSNGKKKWNTVGVSGNIVEASWQALCDSVRYLLMDAKKTEIGE